MLIKFIVTLNMDAEPQQPGILAATIHEALEHWRMECGLTADEDESMVESVRSVERIT